MEIYECHVGMVVRIIQTGFDNETFTIIKVNRVNVKLQGNSSGRLVNGSPHYLIRAEDDNGQSFKFIDYPTFYVGEMVISKNGLKGHRKDDVFVVIRVSSNGQINIAKLGGDNGRYWKTNANAIERVTNV